MGILILILFIFIVLPITIILSIIYSICIYDSEDWISFNPKQNYEKWDNLNWFWVWCGTIALIIAWYPVAIYRAIRKLLYWLFTVGRKK